MSFSDLMYLILASALGWYWLDGMRAKEIANYAGKRVSAESSVLFLDDSVVIVKTRLKRNDRGQVALYRVYHFEFTSDGEQRYHGEIHMMGKRVIETSMDAYRI